LTGLIVRNANSHQAQVAALIRRRFGGLRAFAAIPYLVANCFRIDLANASARRWQPASSSGMLSKRVTWGKDGCGLCVQLGQQGQHALP